MLGLDKWLINRSYQYLSFFLVKMVDSLYLVFDRSRWLVVSTCKRFSLMELWTIRYLNKYLFRERKYNNTLKRDVLEIYMR